MRRQQTFDELANKSFSGPGKFYPIKCDVSKEEEVKEAFKWIKEKLGAVHILVNNAGLIRDGFLHSELCSNSYTEANGLRLY